MLTQSEYNEIVKEYETLIQNNIEEVHAANQVFYEDMSDVERPGLCTTAIENLITLKTTIDQLNNFLKSEDTPQEIESAANRIWVVLLYVEKVHRGRNRRFRTTKLGQIKMGTK